MDNNNIVPNEDALHHPNQRVRAERPNFLAENINHINHSRRQMVQEIERNAFQGGGYGGAFHGMPTSHRLSHQNFMTRMNNAAGSSFSGENVYSGPNSIGPYGNFFGAPAAPMDSPMRPAMGAPIGHPVVPPMGTPTGFPPTGSMAPSTSRNYIFFGETSSYSSYPPHVTPGMKNKSTTFSPFKRRSDRSATSHYVPKIARNVCKSEKSATSSETLKVVNNDTTLVPAPSGLLAPSNVPESSTQPDTDEPIQSLKNEVTENFCEDSIRDTGSHSSADSVPSQSSSPLSDVSSDRSIKVTNHSNEASLNEKEQDQPEKSIVFKRSNRRDASLWLHTDQFFKGNEFTTKGELKFLTIAEIHRGEFLRLIICNALKHTTMYPAQKGIVCNRLNIFLQWLGRIQNGVALKFDEEMEEDAPLLVTVVQISNLDVLRHFLLLPGVKLTTAVKGTERLLDVAYELEDVHVFKYLVQKGICSLSYSHCTDGENEKQKRMVQIAKFHFKDVSEAIMDRLSSDAWLSRLLPRGFCVSMLPDGTTLKFDSEQQEDRVMLVIFEMTFNRKRGTYHIHENSVSLEQGSHINGQHLNRIGSEQRPGGTFHVPFLQARDNIMRLKVTGNKRSPPGFFLVAQFLKKD